MRFSGLPVVMSLLCTSGMAQDAAVDVGRFDATLNAFPVPWQVIRLDKRVPPPQYRLISWDGVVAVEAVANASMALLARPLAVDLARTPVLCWRWRIEAPLKTADMSTRQGDDYAARVYLAFSLQPSG